MDPTNLILALLLGVGLSASTGLNTFLPLLLLSAAARFQIAGITLGERFDWLSSDVAIVVLIIASIVEIVADKVPAVDHVLDSVGTFIRPLAGALASASVLTGLDPTVAAIVGLLIGAPTSLSFHSVKAAARAGSSLTTFGCANPVLSLIEDVISIALTAIAIFVPVIVPLAVLLCGLLLWRILRRIRRNAALPTARP